MSFKNISICIFLLGITLTGFVNTQRITIPLKKTTADQLFVTVKYGLDECEVNLQTVTGWCQNVIAEKVAIPDHCGSQLVSQDTQGQSFIAPFQLGDTEADLSFIVPNASSSYRNTQSLCLGASVSASQTNALYQLFGENKISTRVAYFYQTNTNQSNDENTAIGTLSLGEPIHSLSKGNFVTLSKGSSDSTYSAGAKSTFTAFGKVFNSRGLVYINTDTAFSGLESFAFDDLIKVFKQRGIKVTIIPQTYDQLTFIDSIDQLEPLNFTFIQEDKVSTYNVSLTPSQYTRRLADGTFQLLINPLVYTGSVSIGNTILQSHNIAYSFDAQRILIAEKQESSNSNFRGAQIKL